MRWLDTSRPNTSTMPGPAGSSVVISRIVVVLPAPFGPSSPKISPSSTSRSIPSTATAPPNACRSPRQTTAYFVASSFVASSVISPLSADS